LFFDIINFLTLNILQYYIISFFFLFDLDIHRIYTKRQLERQ